MRMYMKGIQMRETLKHLVLRSYSISTGIQSIEPTEIWLSNFHKILIDYYQFCLEVSISPINFGRQMATSRVKHMKISYDAFTRLKSAVLTRTLSYLVGK